MSPFIKHNDIAPNIAAAARARRLAADLSRKSLSARSGVPEGTIKRFETTGAIALKSLLKLARALGCLDEFKALFPPPTEPVRLDEILKPARQRGRG
ncbi:MAG TPA: helix-turn-helix transcriptional regulator [Castellaniella sp.]|uniref:helix-turn-helix transcriptional regulator n=1 Tax=Castellaniella sp. TaxID=1955812 RepID=UPI002EFA2E58